MCPLRLVLIFLSATLAGFFVLRSLKTNLDEDQTESEDHQQKEADERKWWDRVRSVFWTCVDMASGRYLWRNLVAVDKDK